MAMAKIEFAVQMNCQSCVESVKKCLENVEGIKSFNVDLGNQSVVVDSNLSTLEIQKYLESTGKKVRVRGHDGSLAAVSIIDAGDRNIQGVVRFVQVSKDVCLLDGTVDGLSPGLHRIYIHECGDISGGCSTVGDIFNPQKSQNGRVYGDVGEIEADTSGRSTFRLEDGSIKLSDIIGRSIVIADEAEKGKQGNRLACGIIARSAGLFGNPKTICACDGISIWDEIKKPEKRSAL